MNEKLKEIIKKYELTSKDIKQSIDQLELGKVCNTSCMVAFAELLVELECTAIKMEKKIYIYKVFLLDKDSSTHPAKEWFKTKCTEEEIRELVGKLNFYNNNNNEKQHYIYYLVTTEGE